MRATGTHTSQSPSACSTDGAKPLLPVDCSGVGSHSFRPTALFRRGDGWEELGTQVGIATSGSVLSGLCNQKQVGKVRKGTSLLSHTQSLVNQCFTSLAVKQKSAICQSFVLSAKPHPCLAFPSGGFTSFLATAGASKAPLTPTITHQSMP